MATANDVLNIMRSWIGYSTTNGMHKIIIDIYNLHAPLARGYKVKYTDQWCATTVSAAAIKAGAVGIIGTECGCEEFVRIFKAKGIWEEDGTITPKPGDIIVYNWDKLTQPNDGYSDHIGYVEAVANDVIVAIEGNKDRAVGRRVIDIGAGQIRGFAQPKYEYDCTSITLAQEVADIVNGKYIWDNLSKYLNALPTSEYAEEASRAAIAAGWFSDGDGDKMVDHPRGILIRQDLAKVLHNGKLF